MSDRSAPAVVIDNGSGLCKAGFSGEKSPRVVIPSIVGTAKCPAILHGIERKDKYVGSEAHERRGILSLSYPIEHGIVTNWEDMEKIWTQTFHWLNVQPKDRCVLLTEPPLNPEGNREKMVEIMFETYQARGCYVAVQAALSLYTTHKSDGLVLDCGDGVSHVVPVYKGHMIPNAVCRLDFGGRDLNDYMSSLLRERGYALTSSAELEIVRDIKEKLCYVADDCEEEMQMSKEDMEKEYMLPDGESLSIGDERFRCPEFLFKPILNGVDLPGIHDAVYEAIKRSPMDIRKNLWENIVLAGGTTMFPGMVDKIKKQLMSKYKGSNVINITALDNRRFSAWIGGSMLTSHDGFDRQWITKAQFEEEGVGVVHRKCV